MHPLQGGQTSSSKRSCKETAELHTVPEGFPVRTKYKALILWHLINKTLRFNEISKLIPKATPKMLTQQLRELERDLLIIRVVYPVVPPKVEYSLSNLGKSIIPVLDAMCNWGEGYLDGQSCK